VESRGFWGLCMIGVGVGCILFRYVCGWGLSCKCGVLRGVNYAGMLMGLVKVVDNEF